MASSIEEYDIVIVGGGIVGAVAACQLSQQYSKIALVDKGAPTTWQASDPLGLRVSALNLASKQCFQQIGIWHEIESMRAYPYTSMFVWEHSGEAEIEFNANETSYDSLGAIVENQVILAALNNAIHNNENVTRFNECSLKDCHAISNSAMLIELEDDQKLSSQLL